MKNSNISSLLDELEFIYIIFGFKIEPNINDLLFEDGSEIQITLNFPTEKNTETKSDFRIILTLNTINSNSYKITSFNIDAINGTNDEVSDLNERAQKYFLNEVTTPTILNLILKIEPHFNKKIKIIRKPFIKATYHNNLNGSPLTPKIHQTGFSLNERPINKCIDDLIFKRVNLNNIIDNKPKAFKLNSCVQHHCGVCLVKGNSCDFQDFFSFKIWNFSNTFLEDESLNISLSNIAENINLTEEIFHENLAPRPKAFVFNTATEIYFLLGTPIYPDSSIPLCNYLEGMMVNVSHIFVYTIITQILSVLDLLHSKNWVHACLFPCNILLGPNIKLKILDHRHVRKVWDIRKCLNSVSGESDNLIKLHHFQRFDEFYSFSQKGDILYFGLIILSLCRCCIHDTLPLNIPKFLNVKLYDFVNRCVDCLEKKRASTYELLNHPYILEFDSSESIFVSGYVENPNLKGSEFSNFSHKFNQSRFSTEFKLIRFIGKGRFGVVVLAENYVDGCLYAIKRINFKSREINESTQIIQEVKILSTLNHPNVIRYYNVWCEDIDSPWFEKNSHSRENSSSNITTDSLDNTSKLQTYIYKQMEYCSKKTLREIISNENLYQNHIQIWKFFRGIASGLAYIHSNKMIHCDIKPENILISGSYEAKIAAFNLTKVGCNKFPFSHQNLCTFPLESFVYKAPELENQTELSDFITNKIDMYSFGIVFFEMCHPSFETNTDRKDVLNKIKINSTIPDLNDLTKMEIIKGLVNKNPSERFSANQILSLKYPVFVEDFMINDIVQHLSNNQHSMQSKKLLKAFFTHDHNIENSQQYYNQNHFLNTKTFFCDFHNFSCVKRFIDQFCHIRGCIPCPYPPIFYPVFVNNVFINTLSLCFLDSNGIKLHLSTYIYPYLFDFVQNYQIMDIFSLPTLRFGGVYPSFMDIQGYKFSQDPLFEQEFYYSIFTHIDMKYDAICECISETLKVISFFYEENLSQKDSTKNILIHVNHTKLLIEVLKLIDTDDKHIKIILTKLSELSRINDINERLISLQKFFDECLLFKNKSCLLFRLFSFRNDLNELINFLTKILRKTNSVFDEYLDEMRNLFSLIKNYSNNFSIFVNFGLVLSHIWPFEDFVFQILDQCEFTSSSIKTSIITHGGIFKANPKNKPFKYKNLNDCCFAYSTTYMKYITSLSDIYHLKKSCPFVSLNSSHSFVILCCTEYVINENIIGRLHSDAEYLRNYPFNLSVIVNYYPIKIEHLKKPNFRCFNITAVLYTMPRNIQQFKVVMLERQNVPDIVFYCLDDAAIFIKNEVSNYFRTVDNFSLSLQHKSLNKLEVMYLYLDPCISIILKKLYQTNISHQLSMIISRLNTNSRFVVIVADLSDQDFCSLISDVSFDHKNFEVSLNKNLQYSYPPKIHEILRMIAENSHTRVFETAYMIYNIKRNILKPII